jgi:Mg/Co/Ni transporter MgtE
MELSATRDWMLNRVAVRQRTHRLGRRRPIQILAWAAVRGLGAVEIAHQARGTRQLLTVFDSMRAVDVASALLDLPVKRRNEVADALDDERLADILEELPEDDQREILAHLGGERAADVLEAMNPDDAADLLGELPEADQKRLLELMEPEESASIRRLLEYSADTAGGLMTPEPIVLTPHAKVAEALARIRNPDLTPALASMVFVCRSPSATPTGRYLGCVHAQRLLREPPTQVVGGIVDADLARLSPNTPLGELTRYFAAYNLVCGPVVDSDGHLLGAVTVDDVLDHLLPKDWREGRLPDVDERASTAEGGLSDV